MTDASAHVTPWRHARAIALLPVMNTIVIPGVLLTIWPPAPTARVAATTALLLAGVALALAGFWLVGHSIRLFVRLGHGTLAPWDPTQALVTDGAYRYSRNPMKGGLFLILAGEALVTQSAPLAAWFACFSLVNAVYIRLHEEPRLDARFGARYRDYRTRVPRWWPKLATLRNRATKAATP